MNEEEGEEAAGGQRRALRDDGRKTEAVKKKKGTNPRHVGVAGIHHVIALPGSHGPMHMMNHDRSMYSLAAYTVRPTFGWNK